MAERQSGKLKYWDADRAFGFIVPDGGGASVFVHTTDTALGSRDPMIGDEVTFELERTGQTWRARSVVFTDYLPVKSGRMTRLDAQ